MASAALKDGVKITQPDRRSASSSNLESLESQRRRILVVEDNAQARKQLQQLLQMDPQLQIDAANDGRQALEFLAEKHYSIVITDLKMPALGGIELIEEVQKQGRDVTVIVTTGHGSIDQAVQAIRLGAYDFLTKPIDVDHLRLVIDRALRERALG